MGQSFGGRMMPLLIQWTLDLWYGYFDTIFTVGMEG